MNRLPGVGGADGCAMKFWSDIARAWPAEEEVGEQWLLTPLSVSPDGAYEYL